MNASEKLYLPDIQSQTDSRDIAITAVGIKGLRYPVSIRTGDRIMPTIATLSMTVGLAATFKGTHMSRFVELLESQDSPLDHTRFKNLTFDMLRRLEAKSGEIEMRFPYFIKKTAPVSRVQSILDYEVCWRTAVSKANTCELWMAVTVAATSLCPCSKEISSYGAHNQRSHITINARLLDEMQIDELIRIAEDSASCEVYGLLKRIDEKYVTERAYDNPKFVEDMVRDVATSLNRNPGILQYIVEVENFESIHNHSAFARIESN